MDKKETKYERARKKVRDIKGFYSHLTVYLMVNVALQLFYAGVFDSGSWTGHFPYWVRFTTPFFWGLSLAVHGIVVFKGHRFKNIFRAWEERKIKELMEQHDDELQRWK